MNDFPSSLPQTAI